MTVEKFLRQNIDEFTREANEAYLNGAYNSAVTLYFKALAVLADWHLYQLTKTVPRNHAERFQKLKSLAPSVYALLDQAFPVYQDSYRLRITKGMAAAVKKLYEDARRIIGFAPGGEER